MRWFKHMTDAAFNRKITAVEDELGLLGSGLFWRIMEVVGAQLDEKRRTFAEHSAKTWGNFCRISAKKFTKYAEILEKNELIFIKKNQNSITIDIPNILEYMDEHTRRRLRDSGVTLESLRSNSGPDTDTEEEREEDTEKEKDSPQPPSPGGDEGGAETLTQPAHLGAEIIREYNAILTELEPAVVMSSGMSLNLKLNREEHPERDQIGFWVGLFHKARASPHLMGRLKGGNWKASLPWLLIPDNVDNILNGKYPPDKGEEKKHAIDYGSGPRPMGAKPNPKKN